MRGEENDRSRRGARGGGTISRETTQRLIELSGRADHFVSEHRAGLLPLGPVRALLPNSSVVDVGLHEKVGSLGESDGSQSGARGIPGRGQVHTLDSVEGQIHPEAIAFGINVPGQYLASFGAVRNQVVRASPGCNPMPGANRKVRALDDGNCCERDKILSVFITAITKAGQGPEIATYAPQRGSSLASPRRMPSRVQEEKGGIQWTQL